MFLLIKYLKSDIINYEYTEYYAKEIYYDNKQNTIEEFSFFSKFRS